MVGITLTLIWAAVVLTNPYSLALLMALGIFSVLHQRRQRQHQEERRK
jgi:hypothetical protein